MRLTRLAILARFKGNYGDAIQYCEDVARVYPHLRGEYRQHREGLLDLMQFETSIKHAKAGDSVMSTLNKVPGTCPWKRNGYPCPYDKNGKPCPYER